jgi:hypothetical protein
MDTDVVDTFGRNENDARRKRFKEALPHLSEADIDTICSVIADTCNYCWENGSGCHCMNDE